MCELGELSLDDAWVEYILPEFALKEPLVGTYQFNIQAFILGYEDSPGESETFTIDFADPCTNTELTIVTISDVDLFIDEV